MRENKDIFYPELCSTDIVYIETEDGTVAYENIIKAIEDEDFVGKINRNATKFPVGYNPDKWIRDNAYVTFDKRKNRKNVWKICGALRDMNDRVVPGAYVIKCVGHMY